MDALFSLVTAAVFVLQIVVHVTFALVVWNHAQGSRPVFVGPGIWALGTLTGGPLVALAYWLMNVSTLRPAGETS